MSTIINQMNRNKLQSIIDKAEGRAQSRTISADDLIEIALRVEQEIKDRTLLPAKSLVGARVRFAEGHPLPNSYNYTAYRTKVLLERRASGWALVSASRADNKARDLLSITLTQDQSDKARERFESRFSVAA